MKCFVLIFSSLFLQSCTYLFFHPTHETFLTPAQLNIPYEDVYLTTPDNIKLHAWYIPAVLPKNATPKGSILFLHGNAENISTHTFNVIWLVKEGYNLMALDYRGYGKSEGTPDFKGMETDINTAVKYLTERTGGKIFLLGQSLGGALTVSALAKSKDQDKISGIIVDSAFSNSRRIAREKVAGIWLLWPFQYPLSYLVKENDAEGSIKNLKMPKLFIAVMDDEVVPATHTQILYNAAPEPKQLLTLPVGFHIQALLNEQVRKEFLDFLNTYGVQSNPNSIK